jgi:hypothetical protein
MNELWQSNLTLNNELSSCLSIVRCTETCSIGYEYWSVYLTIILHSYSMNLQSQNMLRTSYTFLYFTLGILRSETEIIYSSEFTAVYLHFQVSKSKWMLLGELCHYEISVCCNCVWTARDKVSQVSALTQLVNYHGRARILIVLNLFKDCLSAVWEAWIA